MPRVLIISPSAYIRGGVETLVHDLCVALPKRGWDVVLGLTAGKHFHNVDRYVAENPGLPIHIISAPFSTPRARVSAIMEAVRVTDANMVVTTRIGDTYEAIGRLKRTGDKRRLAVAVRGFEAQYIVDVTRFNGIIDSCFADGTLLRQACISVAGMEAERVFNLPAGIKTLTRIATPRKAGQVLRIGYVGRLANADKRVLDLIPLVHHLHESSFSFSLDIAGTGPEEAELKRALGPWQGSIRFHGWLTREELYERIFPEIDCVLNFSPTEGLTIAPREALIHGVVCVLSGFPGLQLEGLFVHGHNALTFPTGDIQMAAQHLISLQREPGLLEWLSTNALQAQNGKYTFEGAADAWADALDRCLAMPAKVDPNFRLKADPAGRLEAWGLPSAIADRVRWWLGRELVPLDPGSEWPHGRVPVPLGEQDRLESWAARLENQWVTMLASTTIHAHQTKSDRSNANFQI
jgi:glycosyltransferase involved in cell wall biosynthesis